METIYLGDSNGYCIHHISTSARHSLVFGRSCKISAVADAPTTVLRTVPRPSQGGLWDHPYHQFSAAANCPMGLLLGP